MIDVTIDTTIEGGHGNLLLRLEAIGFTQVADTYYLAIDPSFMKDDVSERKVILNLRNLLEWWSASVEKLETEGVTYLPFDFSDQYIGCLRVAMRDAQILSVDYGSTRKFQGDSFDPSQCEAFVLADKDYNKSTDSFTCKKSVMLSDVKHSMDGMRNLLERSADYEPGTL